MLPADYVSGSQWYLDALPYSTDTAPRGVVTVVALDQEFTAILDTGANQCVLEWAIAEPLLSGSDDWLPQTRALGGQVHNGVLFPIVLTLPADEGDPVAVETSAWSAQSFGGPNLIGYGGLLEKLGTAIDPGSNRFYFGA
jgi:hypothetical protein